MRSLLLVAAAAAALTAPAAAEPTRDALKEAAKCVEIAAATDRLKCFDAAMLQAQAALATQGPVAPQVAEEESSGGVMSWFGLSKPAPVRKPEDFGKPPPRATGPAEITSLSASVLEYAKNAYGRSLFILDNGQVWKQIDGDTTELQEPRKGETMRITIEEGMLGSYNLTVEGRTGMLRVRRVK